MLDAQGTGGNELLVNAPGRTTNVSDPILLPPAAADVAVRRTRWGGRLTNPPTADWSVAVAAGLGTPPTK
jgi:hypothetical protein